MKVRVKKGCKGYYGIQRRREFDVFDIKSEKEFSSRWMEKYDGKKGKAKLEPEPEESLDSGESEVI